MVAHMIHGQGVAWQIWDRTTATVAHYPITVCIVRVLYWPLYYMYVLTECDGYLRPYELHAGVPQYLLPGEEFTYECVSSCDPPNELHEGVCEGKHYITLMCIKWSSSF